MKKFIFTEKHVDQVLSLLREIPAKFSIQIIQLIYSILQVTLLKDENRENLEENKTKEKENKKEAA